MVSRRQQIIALAVLAVVAVALSFSALQQAKDAASVPAIPVPTPELPTITPTPRANGSPSATPTPNQPTPVTSPSPTPSAAAAGLAGLSTLLDGDEPVSIMVFGDGSGDQGDEWVRTWTLDHLAKDRPVTYRSWNRDTQKWRPANPDGGPGVVTVWNASRRSPDLAGEPARVAKASEPADVVLLSYGHRKTAAEIAPALTKIRRAIEKQNPAATIIVMLQNPDPVASQYQQQATVEAVKKWAKAADLDTVNIYDAFIADPAPRSHLVETDGSPTATGSKLWAAALQAAIEKPAH